MRGVIQLFFQASLGLPFRQFSACGWRKLRFVVDLTYGPWFTWSPLGVYKSPSFTLRGSNDRSDSVTGKFGSVWSCGPIVCHWRTFPQNSTPGPPQPGKCSPPKWNFRPSGGIHSVGPVWEK
eukprot:gene23743-biopygen17847